MFNGRLLLSGRAPKSMTSSRNSDRRVRISAALCSLHPSAKSSSETGLERMTRNSSILLITAAASIELFYSVGDALAELKGIRIREDRLNNAVATISDPALEHQAGVDDGDLLNMSGPIGEAVEGQTVTSLRGIVEPSPREEAPLVRGIAGVAQESFADSSLTGMDWPIEGLDKALRSPSVEAFRDEKRICFVLRNDGGDVDALPAGCGSCRYPRRFLPGDSGARFG